MSVSKTKRRDVQAGEFPVNLVIAYEPFPEDAFVETYLTVPGGKHLLSTLSIDRYQAAVDWAVGMADQMAFPIEIVTLTAEEFLKRRREQLERGLAAMSDQERGALRGDVVKAVVEVMRDCDETEVRADACDVLVKLGVVK